MWGKADELRLSVLMGLRKGLSLIRGMRRRYLVSHEDGMANTPKSTNNPQKQQQRHWLDHAAVYAASFAALAAAAAAGAGAWQASVASDTEHRQLRAYVGIIQHGIENFGEANQILRVTRKNYGVTPAMDIFMSPLRSDVVQMPAQFGPMLCFPAPQVQNTFTLFPGQESNFEFRGPSLSNGAAITKQQVDLVRDGSQYQMLYWGALFYKDIFGAQRCARFCWGFKGKSMGENNVDLCLQHNDSY